MKYSRVENMVNYLLENSDIPKEYIDKMDLEELEYYYNEEQNDYCNPAPPF